MITKNNTEKILTQKKHLQEKIDDQKQQWEKIIKILEDFVKNMDTQASFACEKIKEQCPFIKVINKKTFDQLDQQKKTFIQQKEQIETTIITIETELKELANTPQQENKTIETLENQRKEAEKNIEIIKSFLQDINYKSIEILYDQYTKQDKVVKELDKNISNLEEEIKQVDEWKIQLQKAIVQKESLEKQLNEYVITIAEKEQERKIIEQEKENIDSVTTKHLEENHIAMKQYYHDIDILINEFKQHQLERQKLEEQETILGNLYAIFSKELLLLVLQDHLPVVNDIVNNYLSQIVDYQISLQLSNDGEKVELEAKIIDEKGMRDTKSLS